MLMRLARLIPTSWWRLTDAEANKHLPTDFETYYDEESEKHFHEVIDSDQCMHLGYAPRPQGAWQQFRHDLGHGLLMQYPLHKVLWWSILNFGEFRVLYLTLEELENLPHVSVGIEGWQEQAYKHEKFVAVDDEGNFLGIMSKKEEK